MMLNDSRWNLFFSIDNDPTLTMKFIKQVTYSLHPTYQPSTVTIYEAPFLIEKTGWGAFVVHCEVVLTDGNIYKVAHLLEFRKGGRIFSFEINYQKDVFA